jgi:hypothetical protein
VPKKHDALKIALADLVFKSIEHAVLDMPYIVRDPAHEPLEDTVVHVIPISNLELMVRVIAHGKTRYFAVKVSEDK